MKFATYLALVGASQACTSQEKVDALAAKATAVTAYSTVAGLKTSDVEAYETALTPLQQHVTAMTVELEIAQKKNIAAEIVEANTNLTAAQSALNAHITTGSNAAYHKILVDIDDANDAQLLKFQAVFDSINNCVPDVVNTFRATKLAERKVEIKYDEMSADDKAAFDKKVTDRLTKNNADDAKMKNTAKYHEMTVDEQAMYDKMLVAQKTLKNEEMKSFDKGQAADKIAANYDSMTDAEKAAYKEKMSMFKKGFGERKEGEMQNNMKAKIQAGYKKMSDKEKAAFDAKMDKMKQGRNDDEVNMKAKLQARKTKAGFAQMTDAQKKAFLKDFQEDMKQKMGTKENGRMQDMTQMNKMGYFQMNDTGKKNFNDLQTKVQGGRKANDDKWTAKSDAMKKKMANMTDEQKKQYRQKMNADQNNDNNTRFGDRQQNDDYRKKNSYFNASDSRRQQIDESVNYQQSKREATRNPGAGGLGTTCKPQMPGRGDQKGGLGGMQGGPGGQQGGPGGQQGGRGGQQGGPRRMLQAQKNDGPGGMDSMCAPGLCCGHTLSYGVWQTDYICNKADALTFDDYRFQCAEGAKFLASSAVGLIAAVYMMA